MNPLDIDCDGDSEWIDGSCCRNDSQSIIDIKNDLTKHSDYLDELTKTVTEVQSELNVVSGSVSSAAIRLDDCSTAISTMAVNINELTRAHDIIMSSLSTISDSINDLAVNLKLALINQAENLKILSSENTSLCNYVQSCERNLTENVNQSDKMVAELSSTIKKQIGNSLLIELTSLSTTLASLTSGVNKILTQLDNVAAISPIRL